MRTLGGEHFATDGVNQRIIVDGAVTYPKIQNVSVEDRLLGRVTTGAGVVEELSLIHI